MSVAQNKATARRIIEDVLSGGHTELIPQLVDSEWSYRTPLGNEFKGTDGYRQFVSMWRSAFPDLRVTLDDAIGEGDKLAVRFTMHGTFKGKLGNIEPTGRQLNQTSAYFFSYKDGKETGQPAGFTDLLAFSQQLGVKPPGQ